MKIWIWLIAALTVSGLIVMCAVNHATDYADWFAKRQIQQDTQFQTAEDMLRDFPTAAGGKGKKP
jgi:hypothetical protein